MRAALLVCLAGCLSKPGPPGGGDDDATVPAVDPTFAVGDNHACAIDHAGGLWCWGDNENGQVDPANAAPQLLSPTRIGTDTWTAVSAGSSNTCGIAGATVRCWGDDGDHQSAGGASPTSPIALPGFTPASVFVQDHGACAIDAMGKLMCWGNGMPPTAIDPGGRGLSFTQVATNGDHTCALSTEGTVLCWGLNVHLQLGVAGGDATPATAAPRDGTYLAIAVAGQTTCAITTAHVLECWGQSVQALFADTATGDDSMGTIVDSKQHWDALTMDSYDACANADGDVYCYGYSDYGQLGDGYDYHDIPSMSVVQHAAGVLTGDGFMCAHDTSGTVSCWGQNRYGNLGTGDVARTKVPVMATPELDGMPFSGITAGDRHACAVNEIGNVYCWGDNRLGQIDPTSGTQIFTMPHKVPVLQLNARAVTAGNDHTCAIASVSGATDAAVCWGSNANEQLGISGANSHVSMLDQNWSTLSAGPLGTCGVKNGDIFCFGAFPGIPAGTSQPFSTSATLPKGTAAFTEVSLGNEAVIATDDTRVIGWGTQCAATGNPGSTMLVPGAFSVVNVPTIPTGAKVDVAAATNVGGTDSCAVVGLTSGNGKLYCWGNDPQGELGTVPTNGCLAPTDRTSTLTLNSPSTTAPVIAMAGFHGCAENTDANVMCWGDDIDLEIGVRISQDESAIEDPFDPFNWTAYATNLTYSCGISADDHGIYCWGTSIHGELGNNTRFADAPVATLFVP